MAFARTLLSSGASSRVGFVATGMGATSLYGDWAKSNNNLYKRMIVATNNAMASAIAQWGPLSVKLRGMLWVQGESDGFSGAVDVGNSHLNYGVNFQKFVGDVRADLVQYNAQLPVIMVGGGEGWRVGRGG